VKHIDFTIFMPNINTDEEVEQWRSTYKRLHAAEVERFALSRGHVVVYMDEWYDEDVDSSDFLHRPPLIERDVPDEWEGETIWITLKE
jgi:hypothetical protein